MSSTAAATTSACYLSKIQEPAAQEEKTQFIGIKAAYMLGIFGNAGDEHGNRRSSSPR